MKSKRLVSMFFEHVGSPALDPDCDMLQAGENPAMLFGTDEFKVNLRKQAIRFDGIGWISCPGIDRLVPRLEWAGIMKDAEGWSVVFGEGNPYAAIDSGLPIKNGRVIAVPHALSQTPIT
jgi:hypothetical protein